MQNISSSGHVISDEQVRADRLRKGLCDTCKFDPTKCYQIKKRIGGFIRERVPQTAPGKVYNGTCLDCHPDQDPDGARPVHRRARKPSKNRADDRHQHHHHHREHRGPHPREQDSAGRQERRPSRPLPYNMNEEGRRGSSVPNIQQRRPTRERGFLDLKESLVEDQVFRDKNLVQSLPATLQHKDSSDHLQYADDYEREYDRDQQEEQEPEYEYVEEMTYNIFNEPVVVRKRRERSKRNVHQDDSPSSPTQSGRRNNALSPHNSPNRLAHPPFEENVEQGNPWADIKAPPESLNYQNSSPYSPPQSSVRYDDGSGQRHSPNRHSPHRQNSGHHMQSLDEKMPSIPNLTPASSTDRESKSSADSEPLDALALLIAQHCKENPEEPVKFVPGTQAPIRGAVMELEDMSDDMSAFTMETCWQGRNSVATMGTKQRGTRRTNLSAISETSSGNSSRQQKSITSHVLKEPALPPQAAPAHDMDMEHYLESSAPDLLTLREIAGSFTQIGADGEAIDVVTGALIHDNATSMSSDLALFCLTTFWVLARKNDENKRKIIFEDATFDAIIEAMQIYREKSAEIQTRACGVLWSLSMDPNDRKHVAQGGGCEAILNAMLVHMEDEALQVMALGALKVLSFDNIGKSTLRSRSALSIVSDIMQKHSPNPTIQSEGCVILGNLAVDEANQFVAPVTDNEVEAVIMAMIAHPDSLEVHEAA